MTDTSKLLVAFPDILQAALLCQQDMTLVRHPSPTHRQLLSPCCLSFHWSAGALSCLFLSLYFNVPLCMRNLSKSWGSDAAVASRSGALGAAIALRHLLQLSAELDPCLGRLADSPLHRTPEGAP